jgi:signal transduction histidine kinase
VTREPAGAGSRHRALPVLILSVVLIGVVATVLVRSGDPARGIAYGVLGWASALAVGLLAKRFPGPTVVVAGVLSMSADLLQPVPPFPLFPFGLALALALLRGAGAWAISGVVAAYAVSLTAVFVSDDPLTAARGFGLMVILLVALGGGAFLRTRRTRAEEESRRQAVEQRTAIEEERLRIARELHDVLAHSLSSITVQAGVGLHLAEHRPEAAIEALETIRTASRGALDEVRGVLGVLRGDDSAPLTPGPDLDAVGALVEETRSTSARVALDDRLWPRPGRPVQQAVYRVVQEALTNARRHAPGSAVEIVLSRDGGWATASVRDRGPGGPPPQPVDGNGITGMRERAAALGGALDLRPHDDGLEVAVRIPLPASEVST